MNSNMDSPPSGLARRRPRLSQEETERRMLAAAVDMVNRGGLTVSLDHISLEEVIRDAGVSRSAAYRRWPYKDQFFSDLLRELATAATPAAVSEAASVAGVRQVARAHLHLLDAPERRYEFVLELIRHAALNDFTISYESTEWRTYLALHATFLSLADGQLRDEVRAALAAAEQGFTERVARAWAYIAPLFGFRLRPQLDADFETVARLVISSMRGMVIMAQSIPELATGRITANPFGVAAPAEWSMVALGLTGIAAMFLEPDPEIEWSDERRAAIRRFVEVEDWTAVIRPDSIPDGPATAG